MQTNLQSVSVRAFRICQWSGKSDNACRNSF